MRDCASIIPKHRGKGGKTAKYIDNVSNVTRRSIKIEKLAMMIFKNIKEK